MSATTRDIICILILCWTYPHGFSQQLFQGLLDQPGNACFSLDGSNDYILDVKPPSELREFTIELLFKSTNTKPCTGKNVHRRLFSWGANKIEIALCGSELRFYSGAWHPLDVEIRNDQWYHVAMTYANKVFNLHLNGKLIFEKEGRIPRVAQGPLKIGTRSDDSPVETWSGSVDEFRLWSVARSVAGIQQWMNRPLTGREPGLEIYFDFNQGKPGGDNTDLGHIIYDQCANGGQNNGRLHGIALKGNISNYILLDPRITPRTPPHTVPVTPDPEPVTPKPKTEPVIPMPGNLPALNLGGFIRQADNACLSFDGANDHIREIGIPPNLREYTIEMLFKSTNTAPCQGRSAHKRLFSWGDNKIEAAVCGSELRFYTGVWYHLGVTIDKEEWYHLAVVYSNQVFSAFLNGELVIEKQISRHRQVSGPLSIGIRPDQSSSEVWPGAIDEFRLWSVARGQVGIRDQMNKELTGREPGLEIYYNFNQGRPGGDNRALGVILPDQSIGGTKYNGRLWGFTLIGSMSNYVRLDPDIELPVIPDPVPVTPDPEPQPVEPRPVPVPEKPTPTPIPREPEAKPTPKPEEPVRGPELKPTPEKPQPEPQPQPVPIEPDPEATPSPEVPEREPEGTPTPVKPEPEPEPVPTPEEPERGPKPFPHKPEREPVVKPVPVNPQQPPPQADIVYVVPQRTPDGGFYFSINGILYIRYQEQYNIGKLACTIFDKNHDIVLNQVLPVKYGDNTIPVDVATVVNGTDYFNMELTNIKNEKFYIRFK